VPPEKLIASFRILKYGLRNPLDSSAWRFDFTGCTLTMKCGGAVLFTAQPIGFIHSPYHETSAIPKGLGARHDAEGTIELLREYEPGLADIEGFSHLFVLWEFDRADGFDLIAHPPTDAGRPHGVFSTRSPRRPNPIGLTVVELLGREGASLRVRGVDMLDGTPVLDIKPYLSSVPPEKLKRGWLAEAEKGKLSGH
jgi:tRNA-Thr(GGU) m(6)t(6)A37 methyltransferase TsaA